MATAKEAILHAIIEGALYELMVKTVGTQVWLDDNTTLSEKLAEMIEAINLRAKTADVTVEIEAKVKAGIAEIVAGAPEALDTLLELGEAIKDNQDLIDVLNSAIGNKADASTVANIQAAVNALGSLAGKNAISESDLDAALKEKVNAAAQGNHSHDNKTVLDGITAIKVASWDGKSKVYLSTSQPAALTANDLWIQLI